METKDDYEVRAGLLLGPVDNNPQRIKLIVVGTGGKSVKTLTLQVIPPPEFHPFVSELDALVMNAYQPLLPDPGGLWTTVFFKTRSIGKDKVHLADVLVLKNPTWNADLFAIRPPDGRDPDLIDLANLLALLVVNANPGSLERIPHQANISVEQVTNSVRHFHASFKRLAYTAIWDSFKAWDKKVNTLRERRAGLVSVLTESAALSAPPASAEYIETALVGLTKDARIRVADIVLESLLFHPAAFSRLLTNKTVATDVAEWLFRRTFNRTYVQLADWFQPVILYPKQTLISVVRDPSPDAPALLVVLKWEHTPRQVELLQELWNVGKLELRTVLSARMALLSWTHLDKWVRNGIPWPFLDEILPDLFRGRTQPLAMIWDNKTRTLARNPALFSTV